jgi:DNA-binding GntR family transcriptional regulator
VTKIRRETVTDKVIAELRQSILLSQLTPGTALTEEGMSEQLGVSRTTMRQALNTLMLEGLLTRHPTTRVLQVTTLGPDDVRDIYRARRFLELGGIDAADAAQPHQLDELRMAIARLEQAVRRDDLEGFVQADFDCHSAIVGFLGSHHLSEAYGLLVSKLRILISRVTLDAKDNYESLATHQEFVQQILSGDINGARASLELRLHESERVVLAQVRETVDA